MTEQDIIQSESFRLLNFMIDQKVEELVARMVGLKDRINFAFDSSKRKYPSTIDTRVSDEDRQRKPVPLPANYHDLKDTVLWYMNEIARLQNEINELQKMKLVLLNDYDFTRGDDSVQKAIFGLAATEPQ